MDGPPDCLVSTFSATGCLPQNPGFGRAFSVPRTHWDLVKFSRHDPQYDNVLHIIKQIINRQGLDRQEIDGTW